MTIHRDFGNRTNRKLARLKYVLDAWVSRNSRRNSKLGWAAELAPPRGADLDARRRLPGMASPGRWLLVRRRTDYQRPGQRFRRLRTGFATGLSAIVDKYRLEVRLTPQQNIYLAGIRGPGPSHYCCLLREHGIAEPEALPPVLRHAISCPALPTCGQAITDPTHHARSGRRNPKRIKCRRLNSGRRATCVQAAVRMAVHARTPPKSVLLGQA